MGMIEVRIAPDAPAVGAGSGGSAMRVSSMEEFP
jgi:hypothetical protein